MKEQKNDPARTQLVVGILGFVGVIFAALLGVFAPVIQERIRQSNLPSPTPIVIVASPAPTDTVPPGEPTSTPAPTDTPTPEPSLTPTPVPLDAGKDWQEDCISVVWKVFPESTNATMNGNCYAEPLAGALSVRSQKLAIFYNDKASTDQVAGIFVEIPSDSLVEFTAHLDNIQTGELWVGVFAEPKLDTSGVAVGAPAGKMDNSAFVIHKMPGDSKYTTGKTKKTSADYLFSFDVSPSAVGVILEKYTTLDTVPVSSTGGSKWLFIGYKVIAGQTNLISGTISDLKITPR